jgi:hypothetical protein
MADEAEARGDDGPIVDQLRVVSAYLSGELARGEELQGA